MGPQYKAERQSRSERHEEQRLFAFTSLAEEFTQAYLEQQEFDEFLELRVWHSIPHEALDLAQPYLYSLPDEVKAGIRFASIAIRRYNELAALMRTALELAGAAPLVIHDILLSHRGSALAASHSANELLWNYMRETLGIVDPSQSESNGGDLASQAVE